MALLKNGRKVLSSSMTGVLTVHDWGKLDQPGNAFPGMPPELHSHCTHSSPEPQYLERHVLHIASMIWKNNNTNIKMYSSCSCCQDTHSCFLGIRVAV